MRTHVQFLLLVFLVIRSSQVSFAQDEFYNRDSSGYTYRIGPVLPKIQQDWQLGTLGRDFTFGFNPSGVNIENYVLSLLNLPDIRTALQASTATDVFNYLLLQSFQSDRFHGTYPPNFNEGTHLISREGPTQFQVVPFIF